MYKNEFKNTDLRWRSNTTRVVDDETVSKGTFNDMGKGGAKKRENFKYVDKHFTSYDDFAKHCRSRGYAQKIKKNERKSDGFYAMKWKGTPARVYSKKEYVDNILNVNTGLGKNSKFRSFVYYVDVNDPKTHVFTVKERVDS